MSATAAARIAPRDTEEYEIRVQLAACYRLMHKYAMTDLIYTHVAARLPGDDGHFLLNPYGVLFNRITASSLVEVDLEGNVVSGGERGANWAGFIIHGAVLGARPDVQCSLHTHTRAGVALSMLECGVLPISQHAMAFHNRVGYHDYGGFANESEECAALAAALGDHNAMVMRNHGLLTTGQSVAEAFINMFNLEISCKTQLDAMATGSPIVHPSEEACEFIAQSYWDRTGTGKNLAWEALIEELDREDGSFRD
jgi:ribulose-5-phosphate 4-epimerase/fuculose-1-phosphate aldolase